jgi:hypothetical protein
MDMKVICGTMARLRSINVEVTPEGGEGRIKTVNIPESFDLDYVAAPGPYDTLIPSPISVPFSVSAEKIEAYLRGLGAAREWVDKVIEVVGRSRGFNPGEKEFDE